MKILFSKGYLDILKEKTQEAIKSTSKYQAMPTWIQMWLFRGRMATQKSFQVDWIAYSPRDTQDMPHYSSCYEAADVTAMHFESLGVSLA